MHKFYLSIFLTFFLLFTPLFSKANPSDSDIKLLRGSILIDSDPEGAKVRISGIDRSLRTPIRIQNMKVGKTYKISVSLPGFKPWKKSIRIKKETQKFMVTLVPKKN